MDAVPGDTVSLSAELPEPGLDAIWLKESDPLSLTAGRYKTTNQDTSYELVIPDVSIEDAGTYTVQGEGFETSMTLSVVGELTCIEKG